MHTRTSKRSHLHRLQLLLPKLLWLWIGTQQATRSHDPVWPFRWCASSVFAFRFEMTTKPSTMTDNDERSWGSCSALRTVVWAGLNPRSERSRENWRKAKAVKWKRKLANSTIRSRGKEHGDIDWGSEWLEKKGVNFRTNGNASQRGWVVKGITRAFRRMKREEGAKLRKFQTADHSL